MFNVHQEDPLGMPHSRYGWVMGGDEVATFGYPRERSFRTAGQRPLAIRDRRRVERRVATSFENAVGRI